MSERMVDVGRGISLAYEEIGDPGGEPLLLVAGLGQQLHSWPTALCEQLTGRGYRVIRFDNRDAGRSTHLDFPSPGGSGGRSPAGRGSGGWAPSWLSPATIFFGRWSPRQYDLTDLAGDTVGLLDALGLDSAHLVGASMGGMIAQTVASLCPQRVRTLVSIMSTTGARRVGRPALSTWLLLAATSPRTRAAAVAGSVRIFRHIGSHGFPFDEAWVRGQAGLAWDRDPTSDGTRRQLAGIFRSGDRTAALRAITAPTLVIHGDRDRMVHPTGAAATARAIPGARLETIRGMGHDLPRGAWPVLIDLIDDHARRNTRRTDAAKST